VKSAILFASCLSLFAALPAQAMGSGSCAEKSAQMKSSERSAYMKSCLAQASSPANVKEVEAQHKSALCEQNAKNQKLQGNERASYLSTCMNENEAAAAAKNAPTSPAAMAPHQTTAKPAPAHAEKQAKPKHKAKHDKKQEKKQ
jgi:hypothetical protein